MKTGFSIYEQALTNQTVTIIYKPDQTVTSYQIDVLKEKEKVDTFHISSSKTSKIVLEDSGKYQLKATLKFKDGTTKEEVSGFYHLDTTAPMIVLKSDYVEVIKRKNASFDCKELEGHVRVVDLQDGDLFSSLTCDTKEATLNELGPTKITCSVQDQAGNIETKEIILNVVEDHSKELNFLLGTVITIACLFVLLILRFLRSTAKEKKVSVYAVEALHDKRESISEKIARIYYYLLEKMNKLARKSTFLQKYAKKYEKYIPLYSSHYEEGISFVSTKLLVGLLLVCVSILASIIQYKLISIYALILPFILGFFLLDIVFIINYKLYKKQIENDLLQAIIIMNNAFKSGRSITQAIELVTKELDGPIGLEFKKMHMEISFGLTVEEVFKRLASRIELEEVTYLTASLSILNKTGGNIIKVFSSIEKTLFNKKKLKLELASLTGSSKMIIYVLFLVPFFFVLFIGMISPSYFEPFYTTKIGIVFMILMALIYLVYVWAVRKIMKVRM